MTLRDECNEIKDFLDGRYIAPYEACWRIFKFKIIDKKPAIHRLSFVF